jgi:hypothetical protein
VEKQVSNVLYVTGFVAGIDVMMYQVVMLQMMLKQMVFNVDLEQVV